MLESSHPLSIETIKSNDENIVKFNFNDIYLDYTANDELASQGYLKYMIKAKEDIVIDNIMQNRAAIYFDQNEPIITNLTQNKYVEITLNLESNATIGKLVTLWPNPVEDEIYIKFNGFSEFKVSVYNLLGQEVLSKGILSNNNSLNVTALRTGIYLLKATSKNGNSQTIKFIKN